MSQKFRIGGYGLAEPYVEDVRKKLTIKNPHRINCHYPNWEWVLRFEATHIRDKDEYVWIVYKDETADVLGTLRLMREIDERGWVDLIWSWDDGSEYKDEIHKDELSASKIRRFIENRMHEMYELTLKESNSLPPLQQWNSPMTQPLKDLHKIIQKKNG